MSGKIAQRSRSTLLCFPFRIFSACAFACCSQPCSHQGHAHYQSPHYYLGTYVDLQNSKAREEVDTVLCQFEIQEGLGTVWQRDILVWKQEEGPTLYLFELVLRNILTLQHWLSRSTQ